MTKTSILTPSQSNNTAQNQVQNFDLSILEIVDGKVNLTKICQHFGKRLDHWTKSQNTQRFLQAFKVITPNGGITINKGNNGQEQGSFAHPRIALKLAEWISVDFEIWANDKLYTLINTGKAELFTPKFASERILELEAQVENQKEAVEFYNRVSNSEGLFTLGEGAKQLQMKQCVLTSFLRDRGYIMKSKENTNLPYSKYLTDQKYFVVKVKTYQKEVEHPKTWLTKANSEIVDILYSKTYITPKGLTHLTKAINRFELEQTLNLDYIV
ncbi:MAG: KilA-N domain-containing protein [Fusobacteriaceae bacterium]